MQLFMSPASPFVRKIRVLLREADLLDVVTEVEVATTPMASDKAVIAANPTGKIPTLVRADGPALYDSRVITRFLDDYAGTKFYPEHGIWELLTLEATADAMMDAAVLMTYEHRLRPESQQSPDWVDAQWGKVSRAIGVLDTRWMSQLAGPINMGHIAVACALSYLDLRHDDRSWRDGHAALAKWHAAFSTRDSMRATAP